ncbi:MAG TPA: restriction endonuclease, partial [Burkholderiaceae bacterium]|nr:restriction endonuclease [Burkholderiaceae bacterium]
MSYFLLLILAVILWAFTNIWVALTFFVAASIAVVAEHARKRETQVERAKEVIQQYAAELNIKRRQLTINQSYGLVDESPWEKEMVFFIVNVVQPIVGRIDSEHGNLARIHQFILDVTADFRNTRGGFHSDITPIEYEQYVADTLRGIGWQTKLTKGSGDQGIDVIAEMRNTKVVIQCKLYSSAVGNAAVQEAIAGKAFEDAAHAAVVSNSPYTPLAKQLASSANVFLLHHDQLEKLEEAIFGTSEWKQYPTAQATAAAALPIMVAPPKEPDTIRNAAIVIGLTIAVGVIAKYTDGSESANPPAATSVQPQGQAEGESSPGPTTPPLQNVSDNDESKNSNAIQDEQPKFLQSPAAHHP